MIIMKKYISIIVPIYNASSYITNFLDSLNKQPIDLFEVVFVDDVSQDDSYNVLDNWLSNNAKFSYKLLKNNKNSGPGITRNNGINASSCDYIAFCDADDLLADNFVEKSVKLIKTKKADLIIYDYYITNNEKNYLKKSCLNNNYGFVDKNDVLALSSGMCWGKVYKKNIIKKYNICFPDMMRSEDLVFVKKYISNCDKIFYENSPMYYYVQNDNSIMHSIETMKIENNIKAFNEIKKIGNNDAIEMIFIREYLYLITQIMMLKKYKFGKIREFINQSVLMYPKWYKNKYIKYQPLYLKIILLFIRYKFMLLLKLVFLLKEKGV